MLALSSAAGRLKLLCAVLIALVCVLAAPAAAGAAEFTVDSTLDEPDALVGVGGCLTAGGKCTLRAAIQESDNSVGVKDTIKFAASFNGELADTIAIGASFPIVTDPVTIDGDGAGQCVTAAGVSGPCAGVSGPTGGFGLVVEDDNVTIEGLAVTGALTGIDVINESEGFVASDNWLGVKLDGAAGANNTGLFLDPNSDGATIGGTEAAQRNVFANNNNEGLDIEGASNASVRGNYFGVAPGGAVQASNATDIEVTDSTAGAGFEAVGNEIGATVGPTAIATAACDDGCNVISGASFVGIDLAGIGPNEAPPSGPTTIHGNHIGLDAAGTGAIANTGEGVGVSVAPNTTIGGPQAGDANHINGGPLGVNAGPAAPDLVVQGNLVGLDGAGTSPLAPPTVGVFVESDGLTDPEEEAATISENRFRGGEFAIIQHHQGATIAGNEIAGAETGIMVYGTTAGQGNTIEGNVVEGAEENGILVKDDANRILGNEILESGAAGIRVQNSNLGGTTGNLVGGDAPTDENLISGSGGDAIEIVNLEETENEVARNRGSGNTGLFIDLEATEPVTEPNGPNEGIKPPAFSTATLAGASGGGAKAGAQVRVFRKASAAAGELESFLGEAIADGSGNWEVAYPASIPAGTFVAATQTSEAGGTSELAFATTATPGGGNPPACPAAGPGCPPPPRGDLTPPQTKILKGPKAKTRARTAKFRFSSSEAGSTFECKLDHKPFRRCRSPKKYKRLKPGRHVFSVRATDRAGNIDRTPAKRRFTVLG